MVELARDPSSGAGALANHSCPRPEALGIQRANPGSEATDTEHGSITSE